MCSVTHCDSLHDRQEMKILVLLYNRVAKQQETNTRLMQNEVITNNP